MHPPGSSRENQLAAIQAELDRHRLDLYARNEQLQQILDHGTHEERQSTVNALESALKRIDFLELTVKLIEEGSRRNVTSAMWKEYESMGVCLGEMTLIADDLAARGSHDVADTLRMLIDGLRIIPQNIAHHIERI
jgi:hypothetical protein